jgi:hypothetical protein
MIKRIGLSGIMPNKNEIIPTFSFIDEILIQTVTLIFVACRTSLNAEDNYGHWVEKLMGRSIDKIRKIAFCSQSLGGEVWQ